MDHFPVFLSVVYVIRNHEKHLEGILKNATMQLAPLVSDYELIVIDNASDDQSLIILKELANQTGLPNLQVYALTKEVDNGTASWVGLENSLGDFIAVIDPLTDDISFLPQMLDKAASGVEVVFARNTQKSRQNFLYEAAHTVFNGFYKVFSGVHLEKEAPQYRMLSKRVVNFILQHPQPAITYRHLPATGGFTRSNMEYCSPPLAPQAKRIGESIDRGIRLLISTTGAPMRLVTVLSLFGAAANLVYSLYVVAIGIFKTNVAPGWVSLSLQQSGMFFLISLVLLVLGEYMLHMTSLSNEGPLYHVGQEFTSVRMTRRGKLNVEEVTSSQFPSPEMAAKQLVQ
ncbi:glycosyltransferase [Verminephrobacter aporrectodeae subsp. tuberculatae]|uniref:Glycosyltransferase n=1 Tax=Verminephrobacter aporrectodeae subsp. tuberculatae TaxID=1110392 RepID=A0ABT3KTC8_9BURK|nr:glycosyltransferase [Verminephrobacter aporrectodeae]MCW5321584.1 glycosyltransferase [Verminephrobacter aporrectodeae subsp. tuberculatae]